MLPSGSVFYGEKVVVAAACKFEFFSSYLCLIADWNVRKTRYSDSCESLVAGSLTQKLCAASNLDSGASFGLIAAIAIGVERGPFATAWPHCLERVAWALVADHHL